MEDRPIYTKTRCFDPFPFLTCTEPQKQGIRDLAERLDAHRKRQQQLHPWLTLTAGETVATPRRKQPWPAALPDQVRVVKDSLRAIPLQNPAQIAALFRPSSRTRIAEILETLTALGQTREASGRYTL